MIGYRGSDMDITERKRAEEEMRKFRNISDKANYGTAITIEGGILSYVNEVFAKMHGWEVNDLIGKPISILHNEEQLIRFKSLVDNIDTERGFNAEEVWHLKKDGTTFPTIMNTNIIYDQNNRPEYMAATVIDISERKQIELENRRLTIAIEQSPVAILTTDLEANIQYVSPAFFDITGYTSNEVIGKNVRILRSGKTSIDVYNELWTTLKTGKPWQGEWINRKKDKSLYWESISITPIHDEKGNITSYLAIKQDISQRKNTELEINELNTRLEQKIEERTSQLASTNTNLLSEIEERKIIEIALQSKTEELENFFNVTPDLLCIFNSVGDFIKVNKAWETTLGIPVEMLINKNFTDFIHPDDIDSTYDSIIELANKHATVNFVNRYRTNTNEYKFIEWHSVTQGDIIFSAARDITERKRSEDFEDELLALSPKLTGIPYAEIKPALNMALCRIGQFLGADRAYIFELDTSKSTMSNTFEWCNEGIDAEIDNLQEIPCNVLPEWMNTLRRRENIIIQSVNDLPDSWKSEREILEPQGIQSLIVIPLLVDNNLIGFVGLDAVSNKRTYNPSEINNLKVWGSMIASLINNRRSEGLLEQTRQNYETFFNTIDDFLFVIDHDGKIIHANNTVINRLGFLNDEILDQPILRLHPAERRDEASRILNEMLIGSTEYCPVPIVTKSGKQIPVETKVKPGYWNGKPVVFGVSKDISSIKISEQKFSVAFQANSAMMSISNFENGKFIDVNTAFQEVLAYSFDEIIGKTGKGLGIYIDPNLSLKIQQDLYKNIQVRKLEIQMRTKNGELKTGLLSADSIYVGEIHCLLTVIIDITERKKAEDEIKLARLEADNANKAKSEFLSRMSHELRTPMNSILGFAQLMQMGELNPGQTKGINHIMTSGKHLLDLINEVLDISRIEAGRISLSMEPIQVNNVVLEMIDVVRPMAESRNLQVEIISSASNGVYVKADHQRLKQVLINLLNNAIKYNVDGGSIWIRIGLNQIANASQENVRISIIDTGLGINTEDISKLFTPFERIGADKTTTEGTGLGLAVVEKLMVAMGGSIGVDSVLGEGSTFWIELPKTENPAELIKENYALNETGMKATEEKGRILYIEDNSSNIELIEQLLAVQRPGIQLFTSMTGAKTVQLATDYGVDLILLDLNLPDIHGSEVLEQILQNENTKNIPVVIVSADAMPHQLEKL
ncbi:MAG: PAS domain S-box protein, partial [Bacteroidales bacterium]